MLWLFPGSAGYLSPERGDGSHGTSIWRNDLPTVTTRLIARFNGREFIKQRLICGQMLAVGGAVSLGVALRESGIEWTLTGLGLMGVAMGCIMPAMTAGVLSSAPASMSGSASGILNSSRQVGGTLGVALMGTLVAVDQSDGMTCSFVLTGLMFLAMAGVTRYFIPGPRHSWPRLSGKSFACR